MEAASGLLGAAQTKDGETWGSGSADLPPRSAPHPPPALSFSIGQTGEIYINFLPVGELGATEDGVHSGHWVGAETFLAIDPFAQTIVRKIGKARRQRERRRMNRVKKARHRHAVARSEAASDISDAVDEGPRLGVARA